MEKERNLILLLLVFVTILCAIVCIISFCGAETYADTTKTLIIGQDVISEDTLTIKGVTLLEKFSFVQDSNKICHFGRVGDTTKNSLQYFIDITNSNEVYLKKVTKRYPVQIENGEYIGDATSLSWTNIYVTKTHYYVAYNNIPYGSTMVGKQIFYFYYNDKTFYLPTFTCPGSVFLGWYLNKDFSGQSILSINPSQVTSNLEIYAKWAEETPIEVKNITYDNFKETLSTLDSINYISTSSYYLYEDAYSNLLSKHNLNSCSIYVHTDKGDKTPTNLTTLFDNYQIGTQIEDGKPQYIAIVHPHYNVTYELNGGRENPSEKLFKYYFNKYELFSDNGIPIRDGYTFLGWYQDEALTQTLITSSFVAKDVKLYAKWSKNFDIDFLHFYADEFNEHIDNLGTFSYHEKLNYYVFPYELFDVLENNKNEYISSFSIISENNTSIPYQYTNGEFYAEKGYGEPIYIKLDDREYYKITYMIDDETKNITPLPLFYYTKYELFEIAETKVQKDGYEFLQWYLDEDFTKTPITSDFTPQDINLYPKFSIHHQIDVYYFDTSLEESKYVKVGTTYYYVRANYLCFGSYDDNSQLVEYYNRFDSTSYAVINESGKKIPAHVANSYLLADSDKGEPKYAYIYKHYAIKYYVNGEYYFETTGAQGETAKLPTFVSGFIGRNYDAPVIGKVRVGKDYAIYVFKGWSFTDTSDLTWFTKDEVPLVENYKYGDDEEYVIYMYAYMEFYAKLNSLNSKINYDKYIKETKGIITSDSKYSLDDLMMQHVTLISSGKQNTLAVKLGQFFNLSRFVPNSLKMISKLFNGEKVFINELWNSTLGKVILGAVTLAFIIVALILLKNILKNVLT